MDSQNNFMIKNTGNRNVDAGFNYRKRMKLDEDFESLSLDDVTEDALRCSDYFVQHLVKGKSTVHQDFAKQLDSSAKDCNSLKGKYDTNSSKSGNRKRVRRLYNDSALDDFTELSRCLVNIARDELMNLGCFENSDSFSGDSYVEASKVKRTASSFGPDTGKQVFNGSSNSETKINRRSQKQQFKDFEELASCNNLGTSIVSKSKFNIDKFIVQFIIKWRDAYPKIYKKFFEIYNKYISKKEEFKNDFMDPKDFDHFSPEGFEWWDELIDRLITNNEKGVIRANAKITNRVLQTLLLYPQDRQNSSNQLGCSQTLRSARLAITNTTSSGSISYISPLSPCTIEEVD